MRGLLLALAQAVAGEWLLASSLQHNSGSRLEFMFSLCSLGLLFHGQRNILQVSPLLLRALGSRAWTRRSGWDGTSPLALLGREQDAAFTATLLFAF